MLCRRRLLGGRGREWSFRVLSVETVGIEPTPVCLQGRLAGPWHMRPHEYSRQESNLPRPLCKRGASAARPREFRPAARLQLSSRRFNQSASTWSRTRNPGFAVPRDIRFTTEASVSTPARSRTWTCSFGGSRDGSISPPRQRSGGWSRTNTDGSRARRPAVRRPRNRE